MNILYTGCSIQQFNIYRCIQIGVEYQVDRCRRALTEEGENRESLANLLSSGMWAAESLHLLQRLSEAWDVSVNEGPLRDGRTLQPGKWFGNGWAAWKESFLWSPAAKGTTQHYVVDGFHIWLCGWEVAFLIDDNLVLPFQGPSM